MTLEELAAQPFILATDGCTVNGQSLMKQAGLQLSDIRVTVRDWASACVLVREGMGLALIPESTLPDEQRGLRVMPLNPPIHREFGLVCAQSGEASRPVQALMEVLRKDGIVAGTPIGHRQQRRPSDRSGGGYETLGDA